MPEIATGYECKACGQQNEFPPYVYAHWRESLLHACACGATNELLCGVAVMRNKPKQATTKDNHE